MGRQAGNTVSPLPSNMWERKSFPGLASLARQLPRRTKSFVWLLLRRRELMWPLGGSLVREV